MLIPPLYLAEASSENSGFGAFQINLKSFVFQLITFVLVLVVFKKWLLPPILKTLDDRRVTLERGLADAKASEEKLAEVEQQVKKILAEARTQADASLTEARNNASELISAAEVSAQERAELIIKEAENKLSQDREKMHQELRAELAELVAEATGSVLHEKVDKFKDQSIIERAIGSMAR